MTFALALILVTASVALVIGIGSDDGYAEAGDTFTVANGDGIDIEYMIKADGSTVQVGTSNVRDVAVDPSVVSVNIPGTVQYNGVTYKVVELGSYAFYGCSSLKSITIPDGLTVIGFNTFEGCTSLKSVDIPDSVISICGSAFYDCSSLKSVDMSESVMSIGASAFRGCTSLESVAIPDSVATIGASAFEECSSLTSVAIPYPQA